MISSFFLAGFLHAVSQALLFGFLLVGRLVVFDLSAQGGDLFRCQSL